MATKVVGAEPVVAALKSYGHTEPQIKGWFQKLEAKEVGVKTLEDLKVLAADYNEFKKVGISPIGQLSIRKALGILSSTEIKYDEKTKKVLEQVVESLVEDSKPHTIMTKLETLEQLQGVLVKDNKFPQNDVVEWFKVLKTEEVTSIADLKMLLSDEESLKGIKIPTVAIVYLNKHLKLTQSNTPDEHLEQLKIDILMALMAPAVENARVVAK